MDLPADIINDAQSLWACLSNQRSDGTRIDPVAEIAKTLMRERQRHYGVAEMRSSGLIETIVANIF